MKFPFAPLLPALATLAAARDLPAEYRIENIPATDTSVQTSLVFKTVKGVRYVVQRSHDLEAWSPDETFGAGGEIYGMSHECVVPMREFTAPSSPPPGGGTPSGPAPVNVSVRFTRCSDPGGGTVATWPSLEGSGSASVLIAQDMDDGWDSLPLYWHAAGDFSIFVWHPGATSAAPEEDPGLGFADQAFLEELEAAFPAMNTEVDQNQAVILNAPPPAPPDPNAKVFWRVVADWNVDTDGDGSPDWAEFEIAANPSHPSHALADAFDSDTDGNGVRDGAQLDTDEDGTPDTTDSVLGDELVSTPIIAVPRYALSRSPMLPRPNRRKSLSRSMIGERCSMSTAPGAAERGPRSPSKARIWPSASPLESTTATR